MNSGDLDMAIQCLELYLERVDVELYTANTWFAPSVVGDTHAALARVYVGKHEPQPALQHWIQQRDLMADVVAGNPSHDDSLMG